MRQGKPDQLGGSNSSGAGELNRRSSGPALAPPSPVPSRPTHPKTAPLQTPPLALVGRVKADAAMATVLLGLTTPTYTTCSALLGGWRCDIWSRGRGQR